MKVFHTNDHNHKSLKHRLLLIELLIFFACMLAASIAEAQDVTPPSIVSLSPMDDAVEIAVDAWTFEITFDEDIQIEMTVTKQIVIWDVPGFDQATLASDSEGITIDGPVVTLDFNHDGALNMTPLQENTEYRLSIPSNFFEDLSGNGYAGFNADSDMWNIFTVDTQAPGISNLSPGNNSTGVLINESVTITFDEKTVLGTGTIELYEAAVLIESKDVVSADVTHANDANNGRLSTTFSNLEPEKTYNIRLSAGAVTDNAGNDFAGITDQTTWAFTTMDDESDPPVLDYVYPEHLSTDLIIDDLEGSDGDGLTIQFDEEIIAGTGNIEIRQSVDDALVQSIPMSSDLEITEGAVYIYDLENLPYNEELYVLICATCITDVLGNAYAGNSVGDWRFTTEVGPIAIESLSPQDDAVDVAIDQDLSVTFNQDCQIGINGASKQAVIRRPGGATFEVVALDSDNISGNILTIPHADFEFSQEYYITIDPGVITDLSNTNFEGINETSEWTFTTTGPPDTTAPTVVSFEPATGATDVSLDITELTITFDEDVQKTNPGNIILRDFSNNIIQQYFPTFEDEDVTIDGNVVTLALSGTLTPESGHYVQLLSGTFTDLAGNNFIGFNDASTWIFTTEPAPDLTAPTISALSPENGATGVSVSAPLKLTFDEDIALIPDQFLYIKFVSNGAVRETISTSSSDVSVDGSTLTITPGNDLLSETEFYVQVPAGAVEDLAGNEFAGFDDASTWSFTTGTPLAIESVTPDFNSSNGHVLYLTAKFNQDIAIEGISTNRAIEVYRYSDDQFLSFANVEDVTITGSQLEARLALDVPSGDEVYVSIVDNRIKDLNDNFIEPLDKDFWKFTATWDYVERTAFVPSNFSVKNPIDGEIKIVYEEDVKRGFSGSYTFRKFTGNEIVESFDYSSDLITINGNEVIFEVNNLLEYNTRYFITVLGNPIRSLNEVPAEGFNNNSTFVFTIEPDPALFAQPVTFTPTHEATGVAIDTDISIEFTNPVTAGNGFLSFYDRTTGNFLQSASTSTNMSVSGNSATIALNNDLPYETQVAVRVSDAAFISENLGVLEITDNDTWYFTTEVAPDVSAPSIVSLTPSDNEESVAVDTDLVITFDEVVFVKSGGNILLRTYDMPGLAPFETIEVTSGQVSGSGTTTITINPSSDFPFDFHAFVQIEDDAFEDAAGNVFDGLFSLDQWDFTTAAEVDNTAPSVASLNPAGESTEVSRDVDLVLTFNEPIQLSGTGIFKMFNRATEEQIGGNWSFPPGATVSGNTVTYDIPMDLPYGTEIYFEITNAIEDLAGNRAADIIGSDGWYFTTEGELDPPNIVTRTPANGAVDVAVDTDLVLTFNETVQLTGAGTFRMFNKATDEQIGANWSFPPGATVDGNTITYDIPIDLPYETEIYFQITNAIEDVYENAAANIEGDGDWTVTTGVAPDVTAPTIVSLSPTNNEVGVAVDANLILTFDEPVRSTETGALTVRNRATDEIIGFSWFFPAFSTFDGTQVTFDLPSDLPYETEFYVTTTDGVEDAAGNRFNLTDTEAWTFTTVDNDDPTDITLSANAIDENLEVNSIVGQFAAIDPNESDEHTIEFVPGEGAEDNNAFVLNSFQLRTNEVFDFESKNSYSLRLRVTDNYDNFFEKQFTISINDVEEDPENNNPTDIILSSSEIDENETSGSLVGTLTATDPDNNDTHAFALVSGEGDGDNGSFNINGNELFSAESFDFETKSTYTIRIRTIDSDGGFFEKPFTINVVDVQEMFDQTITFEAISDKTFGESSFDLTATSSSQLAVTYSVVSGPISISGATVSINGAGVATIAADQAGNANYNAAPQVTQSFTINKADQSITIEAIADKLTTDNAFDVVATVDSNLPLTYDVAGPASISGTTITLDGSSGLVTVTVGQAGNSNYNAAVASVSFVVNDPAKTDQTITFNAITDKVFGASFSLTASSSSGLDISYSVVEGSISITGEVVNITGTGSATIAADQDGNASFNPATRVTQTFNIDKADQTITISAIDNKLTVDDAFEIVANVDTGLELTYEVTGPASNSGNTVTLDGTAGTVSIIVTQVGNENYNAASADARFEVSKADQIISVEAIGDKFVTDDPFEIVASVDSELALTFSVNGPATIVEQTITLDGTEGTVTVTVVQEGNETYNSAGQVVSFEVSEEPLALGDGLTEVSIYPNPTVDYLTIESAEEVSIILFDLKGAIIAQDLLSYGKLDLTHVSPGVYMLEVQKGSEKLQRRVVKAN